MLIGSNLLPRRLHIAYKPQKYLSDDLECRRVNAAGHIKLRVGHIGTWIRATPIVFCVKTADLNRAYASCCEWHMIGVEPVKFSSFNGMTQFSGGALQCYY